jgi:ferredoxin
MSARLEISESRCTGHGLCYGAAPNLLSEDEEGYVAQCGTSVQVPAELLDEAQDAENSCPERAISLVRQPSSDHDHEPAT